MNNNTSFQENQSSKQKLTTTIVTDTFIAEMVFNKTLGKTSFFKKDRFEGMSSFVDKFEHDGVTYKPLPLEHDFVRKGVILFPGQAMPYDSEEEILGEIQEFIHAYLDITPEFETIASYYVLFTWLYDRFNEVPYLRAIGDYGSGKSRFLQTIGALCYKPIFTGGATTASPLFRITDEIGGTLIIDEADFEASDMTANIVKILNMGYQKGNSVLRSEGKGTFEVKAYDVYSPKIVATRAKFKDQALESRFLVEEMGFGVLRKDIPRTLDQDFYSKAESIRNKLLMWRLDNYFKGIERNGEIIEGIHPRLNQIVIPLLSIIKDKKVQDKLKKFIIAYNEELIEDRGLSWESDIISAILRLKYKENIRELTVKQIADEVNFDLDEMEEPLTPKKTGWYLRHKLQLKPHKTRKGYVLDLKKNGKRLDRWRERFGVADEDVGVDPLSDNVGNNE